ncbi:hypothetical protein D9M68_669850 [compost metagenome]
MGLAECVAASGERHGLLVVHGHAGEGLADVPRRAERVRVAVRAFRVHIDQAHLDGSQGLGEVTVAAVALVVQPLAFRAPVDVFLWLPYVRAATAETERLEAHGLQRDVTGENYQIAPGQLAAVLLLDRPEQPARLVEVAVVRPAVEGREPLCAGACAAATIADTVGSRGMPGHANEERPIVAVVCGPPVL